jgi:anti-anti-sigma factor
MTDADPVTIQTHGDVMVIGFRQDRIQGLEMPSLIERLMALVEPIDCPRLVLSLAGLDYVPSSFLGLIVVLNRQVNAKGGRVCLARVPPKLWQVFTLSCLDQVFREFATEDEAIASFADPGAA